MFDTEDSWLTNYDPDLDYNDPKVKIACGFEKKKWKAKSQKYTDKALPVFIMGITAWFLSRAINTNIGQIISLCGATAALAVVPRYIYLQHKYSKASEEAHKERMNIIDQKINNAMNPIKSLSMSYTSNAKQVTNEKQENISKPVIIEQAESNDFESININDAFQNMNKSMKEIKNKKQKFKNLKTAVFNNFQDNENALPEINKAALEKKK